MHLLCPIHIHFGAKCIHKSLDKHIYRGSLHAHNRDRARRVGPTAQRHALKVTVIIILTLQIIEVFNRGID
jgi:hypothetical protein